MKRSIVMLAGMSVVAAGLAGCGRSDGTGTTTTPQTGQAVDTAKVGGTVTMWAMGAEGEKLPQLVKDFEAANPGVKVNVTAIPWDSAHDKFKASIAANQTPDLAMVGTTWMGEFAGLGALDPLPPSIDTSQFFEGAAKTAEVKGTTFGVPWYVETRMIYYRTDLAQKAGITTPPTDWQGLKDMAKAMKEKAGATYGIGLQPGGQGSWQSVLPFAWSNGAQVTKDGDTAYNFDTPELTEALSYYASFFSSGLADKAAAVQPTTDADFASGKVPMFISGPWMMAAVEKVGGAGFKDKYDLMQIPGNNGKPSSSFVGGSDLVVFKNTQNRATAWKLVEFLSDPKTQVLWYKLSTDLPSVKSAWQDPALTADPKLAKFGKQLETAKAPPSFSTWEKVADAFDKQVEQVCKAGLDPAAAVKAAQASAMSIGIGK